MGTKMAVAFANIFMAEVETEILNQSGLTGRSSGSDSLTTSSPSEHNQRRGHVVH